MEDPQLQPQSFPSSDSRHTRVMGKLRDSLLSQLAASNPSISVNSDCSSHILRRLQELFSSFNTPSHPPYALMIQRALIGLKDATGSSKEAISEFIKREYKDLPWAHMAILGHHLRKLCDAGELRCTESGRYRVYDGNLGAVGEINKALEWSEGVEREKELQGQEDEKQTQVSLLQIIETNEPSRMQEAQAVWIQEEVEAYEHSIERSEEQNKSGKGFLGIIEQSLPQRQEIGVIEGNADVEEYRRVMAEAENLHNIKIQQIQKLDEDTTFGDPEQQLPKRQHRGRPPKLKSGADRSTSQKQLQPRGQVRGQGRPPKLHGWQKQQLQPSSRGRGRCWSRKLHRDAHRFEEQLQPEDQDQGPVNSLNLDAHQCEEQLQPEDQTQGPVYSLNLFAHQCEETLQPGDLAQGALNFLNSDVHQCEEQLQLEDQTQGATNSHNSDAHQLQPVNQDQGCTNFMNLQPEEKMYSSQPTELNLPATLALISKQQLVVPISEGSSECIPVMGNELSQTPLHGPSGTDLGVKSQVSASPSLLNVNNHDQPQHWNQASLKRYPLENTTLKDLQQQPQKRRRRGRPPKTKPNAGYPGESLLLDDGILSEQNPNVISPSQKKQPSQNQTRVRGRGRPRKVRTDALQCKEQVQLQDRAQSLVSAPNSEPSEIKQLQLAQGSSLDQGRLSKENTPAEQGQVPQLHEFSGVLGRGQSQGRGRGRGRRRGVLGRPPKPMLDSNESKQLPQSQQCLGQVRRRGRPPKQKPHSQPCQVQDQILKSPAEPQPEMDISSTSSMIVYKRKKN